VLLGTLLLAARVGACDLLPPRSCFNQLDLAAELDGDDYSFVLLGHIRGAPGRPSPNPVLRANVDRLLSDQPAFVVSLGDLYYNITHGSDLEMSDWVSSSIPVPFYNVVGNHDTMIGGDQLPGGGRTPSGHDTAAYQRAFGPLYYSFRVASELFIALDTSRGYRLPPRQLEWLERTLAEAAADDSIRNIFLLSHKLFWSYYNDAMAPVFRYRHPVRPPPDLRLFEETVKPLLLPLLPGKRVLLVAGDIGGGRKYLQTFFLEDRQFTYLATGMGNTDRDGFFRVRVRRGVLELEHVNLVSGEIESPANFGVEYWWDFYRRHPDYAAASDRIDSRGHP
jgi:hypothetical protein